MNDIQELRKKFSKEVQEQLGHYVYRLVDPRNGETFYVGQGKGNRVLHHLEKAKKHISSVKNSDIDNEEKINRIKSIWMDGLDVVIVIHRHGLNKREADLVESVLIDCYPYATNIAKGYEHEKGVRNLITLLNSYSAEKADIITDNQKKNDKDGIFADYTIPIIIIKNNRPDPEKPTLYDNIRFAWRIRFERAKNIQYAFGVRYGLIQGMFKIAEWKKATAQNFPEFGINRPGRYGFVGEDAPEYMLKRFLGKRLPDGFMGRGINQPVLYGWIKK